MLESLDPVSNRPFLHLRGAFGTICEVISVQKISSWLLISLRANLPTLNSTINFSKIITKVAVCSTAKAQGVLITSHRKENIYRSQTFRYKEFSWTTFPMSTAELISPLAVMRKNIPSLLSPSCKQGSQIIRQTMRINAWKNKERLKFLSFLKNSQTSNFILVSSFSENTQ